jgi:hypothetical protein
MNNEHQIRREAVHAALKAVNWTIQEKGKREKETWRKTTWEKFRI